MSKICCFTGHRPSKLSGYSAEDNKELLWRIRDEIVNHIENKGVNTFINGCAIGIDLWSAKIVLKLKEIYPNIKLISAVPCKNQYKMWQQKDVLLWWEVINNSDEIVYTSEEDYKPYLMQIRNEWMCNKSDFVIGVWDGTSGGTGNCVKYAEKVKKEITIINPKV